ncbi:MAG: hypothetical protein KatS3mg105_3315 [Gemmatales bacterium]|nr:MAG: hypothetical protein KatS3mg105_3315 [Gemmatales bacterium]
MAQLGWHFGHVAEVWTNGGPTGEFVEVLEGEIQDYGGNTLFKGTADSVFRRQKRFRIPTVLVPTKWRRHQGWYVTGDNIWENIELG